MKQERMCSECEEFFEINLDPKAAIERDRLAEVEGTAYVCPDCTGSVDEELTSDDCLLPLDEGMIDDECLDSEDEISRQGSPQSFNLKGDLTMNTQKQVAITADTKAYISLMEEIKHRTTVVDELINQQINMKYKVIQVESIALQIRMIIESIALASLSANKLLFEQESDKFKKWWRAKWIFRDIEEKNPEFYPKPIKETKSNKPGVKSEIVDIEDGFMTRDEIVEVYDSCCKLLHAKNPYDEDRNYEGFTDQARKWMNGIINLLNSHKIRLLNDDGFYIVHMREAAKEDQANMYYFGPAPSHIQSQLKNAARENNDDNKENP